MTGRGPQQGIGREEIGEGWELLQGMGFLDMERGDR